MHEVQGWSQRVPLLTGSRRKPLPACWKGQENRRYSPYIHLSWTSLRTPLTMPTSSRTGGRVTRPAWLSTAHLGLSEYLRRKHTTCCTATPPPPPLPLPPGVRHEGISPKPQAFASGEDEVNNKHPTRGQRPVNVHNTCVGSLCRRHPDDTRVAHDAPSPGNAKCISKPRAYDNPGIFVEFFSHPSMHRLSRGSFTGRHRKGDCSGHADHHVHVTVAVPCTSCNAHENRHASYFEGRSIGQPHPVIRRRPKGLIAGAGL